MMHSVPCPEISNAWRRSGKALCWQRCLREWLEFLCLSHCMENDLSLVIATHEFLNRLTVTDTSRGTYCLACPLSPNILLPGLFYSPILNSPPGQKTSFSLPSDRSPLFFWMDCLE